MSLSLNFEPHSWYFGFAIKKDDEFNDPCEIIDRDEDPYCRVHGKETGRYDQVCAGFAPKWQAFIDDGMTYRIHDRFSTTLEGLKKEIVLYWFRDGEKHLPVYYEKKLRKAKERYEEVHHRG
jgi:hypothetical protein